MCKYVLDIIQLMMSRQVVSIMNNTVLNAICYFDCCKTFFP